MTTSSVRGRSFRLTEKGRRAFREWMSTPNEPVVEYRHTGMLRLYFSDGLPDEDMLDFAKRHQAWHEEHLRALEELNRTNQPEGFQRKTLEMGLVAERASIDFWKQFAADLADRVACASRRDAG